MKCSLNIYILFASASAVFGNFIACLRKLIYIFIILGLVSCGSGGDKDASMPDDFNFSYSFNDFDKINTFNGTFSRGYKHHDTIVKVMLGKGEMERIYKAMMVNEVLKMPDKFELSGSKNQIPFTTEELIIQMNGKKKTIIHSDQDDPRDKVKGEKYLLMVNVILDVLYNKKEIKGLPQTDHIRE